MVHNLHVDGVVQDRSNSCTLAKESLLSRTKPSCYDCSQMLRISLKTENSLSPTPNACTSFLTLSVFIVAGQPLQYSEVRDIYWCEWVFCPRFLWVYCIVLYYASVSFWNILPNVWCIHQDKIHSRTQCMSTITHKAYILLGIYIANHMPISSDFPLRGTKRFRLNDIDQYINS